MKNILLTISIIILFLRICFSQTLYPNNEDGQFEDMLTPAYYNAPNGDTLRNEINRFVHFAQLESYKHPLEDLTGYIPSYSIKRGFGDEIGPAGNTAQHHPAIDLHIKNGEAEIMYASFSGKIKTYRNAPKYRDYLSITKNIEDSIGNILGKMVFIYAHIDLNLDSLDSILLNGQFVNQGDVISKHLYSGTRGGPHLHFEIRFYLPKDNGDEEFYGFVGPSGDPLLTEPSAGIWSYGYWNPNIGYGFGNPANHLHGLLTGLIEGNEKKTSDYELYQNYPNPFNPSTTINYSLSKSQIVVLDVFNMLGNKVQTLVDEYQNIGNYNIRFNGKELSSGIYFYRLKTNNYLKTKKMLLVR